MKKTLALLTFAFTHSALAIEQTSHLQNVDNLKYGAEILSSVTTCRAFGFTTAKIDAESFIDQFVNQAVKDGMNVQEAQRILHDEIKQQKLNQDYLFNSMIKKVADKHSSGSSDVASSDISEDKDLAEWLTYWWERCNEISQNEFGATFIARDPNLTADVGIAKAKANMLEETKPKSNSKKSKKKK